MLSFPSMCYKGTNSIYKRSLGTAYFLDKICVYMLLPVFKIQYNHKVQRTYISLPYRTIFRGWYDNKWLPMCTFKIMPKSFKIALYSLLLSTWRSGGICCSVFRDVFLSLFFLRVFKGKCRIVLCFLFCGNVVTYLLYVMIHSGMLVYYCTWISDYRRGLKW